MGLRGLQKCMKGVLVVKTIPIDNDGTFSLLNGNNLNL